MNKIRFVLICIALLISINSLWSQTVAKWNTSMGEFEVMMREDLVPITVGFSSHMGLGGLFFPWEGLGSEMQTCIM